jgi:phage gpG-like protein
VAGGTFIDVRADTEAVGKLLKKYRAKGGDLSTTMAIVAETLVAAVSDEFDSSGHGRWAPLAPSTIAARRKAGSGAQILKNSGLFAGSIQPDHGPFFAEAATDVPYAKYHVSEAARSLIPLRNPFDVPDAVLDECTEIIVADMAAFLGR